MGMLVGIVAAVLLLACLLVSSGCSPQTPSNSPSSTASGPSGQPVGAMCYRVAPPLQRADYVCPKCGERTLYDENTPIADEMMKRAVAGVVAKEIASCRREFAELRKVAGDTTMALDESQFCRKCSPKVIAPKLVLHFSYKGKARDIEDIRCHDLQLLCEFFSGKPLKKDATASAGQLEYRRQRLEQLLGVKIDE